MELFISPPPAARDALPTMATPLLPPSASSTMSAATASAVRTRAPPNTHDGGEWHFPSPLPLPSPLLLPPSQKYLVRWLVVASMPPPLVLLTLPPLGASRPVCLSFADWLSCCLLSCNSASCHLLLYSRLTHPSLTPPLCSRQLVVASQMFTPPPPLDAPPPRYWLRCRRQLRRPSKSSLLSYPVAPSPSSLTSLPVVSSQSLTVILFLSARVCICTLNIW